MGEAMTWGLVLFAKRLTQAVATVGRAIGVYCRPTSKDASGPALTSQTALPPPNCDGLALLNQRALLIHRARQSKSRSEARQRLISQVSILTHDILRRGPNATTE